MESCADAIELAFRDCLLTQSERYHTTIPIIPHGEGDGEADAIHLCWKGTGGLWFSLFVTDVDTQIVCEQVPMCTSVDHQTANWVDTLKSHLSEPHASGFFPLLPIDNK